MDAIRKTLIILTIILLPFNSYARIKAKVVRIIDGDTIVVKYDNHLEIIRLLNINTPEKDQDGFFESKAFLISLIMNKNVELESDKKIEPKKIDVIPK